MLDINNISPQLHSVLSDTSDRLVFFFGAGIAASLAGKNYSWEQWVRDGIALLPDTVQQNAFYEKLGDTSKDKQKPSADILISVLEELIDELRQLPGVYEKWMHNAFEVPCVGDPALVETLKKLLLFQDFFVTTNYDDLLEQATGLNGVSYLHPEVVYPMLDEKRNDYVIHIHGRYSANPHDAEDSIIATETQYKAILANEGAQFIQNVIGTRTVIFIGCGQTTSDQNISRFIEFAREHLKINRTFYFLYKEGSLSDDLPDNVEPICYGSDYCDLPVFLEAMAETRLDAFVQRHGFIELFPTALTAEMRSAFSQYYFAAEGISFYGRAAELAAIDDFMAQEGPFLWYALSGQSGSGKSRMALEICRRYGSLWCTFFIKPYVDAALLDEFVPYRDTLIVIDDFKGLEKKVAALIEKLSTLFIKTNYRLRILLCERESSMMFGTWFGDLERSFEKGYLLEFRARRYGGEKRDFLVLDDLKDEEIEDMIGEICERRGLPADKKRNQELRQSYKKRLEKLHYRPLFLQMFVESWIDNGCSATRFDNFTGLLEDILKREQERWLKELDGSYDLFSAWMDLLLLAIVIGKLARADIPEKYLSSFDLILSYVKSHTFPGKQRQERWISLIADMCHNIGQDDAYIEPMYPDIIKEYCFLYYLEMDRVVEVSRDLWDAAPEKFATYLIKVMEDFPYYDMVYAAIDGDAAYRFRPEVLAARGHLLNNYILQPDDDLERRHAWVDREYTFWHEMAKSSDGSDEMRSIFIFRGLEMVAQQYGAQDAPWDRTIDKMLGVYDEALALKGGEPIETLKQLETQKMARRLSIAGEADKAEKLLNKVNSIMETSLGKMLAEETKLEQLNTDMMTYLLRLDFAGGYEVLKKALLHVKRLDTAVVLAYFLGMCHRFGHLAFMERQDRFIERAEYLAGQTEGMFDQDEEVFCARLLVKLNGLQHDIWKKGGQDRKEALRQIFDTAKEKSGKNANLCLGMSGILLLNLMDSAEEITEIRQNVRDRLESTKDGENGEELAQAYLKCMQALKNKKGKLLFTKEEIEDAYAITLRYPESETTREVFIEMLDDSVEAGNRAHYLRREILTAAWSDIRYNLMNPSGLDDLDRLEDSIYETQTYRRPHKKVSANELCPCGSGKKFKKCCRGNGKYD